MHDLQEGYMARSNGGPGATGAVAVEQPQKDHADGCLDSLRRLQADFENYRKRVRRQQGEECERGVEAFIERLLPVLDAFELGLRHEPDALVPLDDSLWAVLEAQGLERLDPARQPFDPSEHEAVVHYEDDDATPVVSEVLRSGYRSTRDDCCARPWSRWAVPERR